jgi:hypothetical protein
LNTQYVTQATVEVEIVRKCCFTALMVDGCAQLTIKKDFVNEMIDRFRPLHAMALSPQTALKIIILS